MMGLPDGQKSFKIGLAILIQYRCATSNQPRCLSIYRAYYVVQVKTIFKMAVVRHLEFSKFGILVK